MLLPRYRRWGCRVRWPGHPDGFDYSVQRGQVAGISTDTRIWETVRDSHCCRVPIITVLRVAYPAENRSADEHQNWHRDERQAAGDSGRQDLVVMHLRDGAHESNTYDDTDQGHQRTRHQLQPSRTRDRR